MCVRVREDDGDNENHILRSRQMCAIVGCLAAAPTRPPSAMYPKNNLQKLNSEGERKIDIIQQSGTTGKIAQGEGLGKCEDEKSTQTHCNVTPVSTQCWQQCGSCIRLRRGCNTPRSYLSIHTRLTNLLTLEACCLGPAEGTCDHKL